MPVISKMAVVPREMVMPGMLDGMADQRFWIVLTAHLRAAVVSGSKIAPTSALPPISNRPWIKGFALTKLLFKKCLKCRAKPTSAPMMIPNVTLAGVTNWPLSSGGFIRFTSSSTAGLGHPTSMTARSEEGVEG